MIGSTLDEIRKSLDLTSKQFAQMLIVSQNDYIGYVDGSEEIPDSVALLGLLFYALGPKHTMNLRRQWLKNKPLNLG